MVETRFLLPVNCKNSVKDLRKEAHFSFILSIIEYTAGNFFLEAWCFSVFSSDLLNFLIVLFSLLVIISLKSWMNLENIGGKALETDLEILATKDFMS